MKKKIIFILCLLLLICCGSSLFIFRNTILGNKQKPSSTKIEINGTKPSNEVVDNIKVENNTNKTPADSDQSTDAPSIPTVPSQGGKRVVTYFPNWGTYQEGHGKSQVSDIPWEKVTHIHHGFFEITNNFEIQSTDKYIDFEKADFKNVQKADWTKYPSTGYPKGTVFGHFGEYKYYKNKYPNVKILISVGGWTRSDKFSDAASTPENRAKLANSMVKFLKEYPFIDGFDLDWEYPTFSRASEDQYDRGAKGRPEDKENFTLLLRDIRAAYIKNGLKNKMLTVAVSAAESKIKMTEPDKYAKYVDYIGVMTYDYAGAWDELTGHLSPLYQNPKDTIRPKFNVNDSMKFFSEVYNVPKSKLLAGTPLYSRGWGGVEPGPNGDGLWQPGNGNISGSLGNGGQYSYFELKKLENSSGWKKYRDPLTKSPYLYNKDKKEFLTYEDEESLKAKINYINQNGYGGVIVWTSTGDIKSSGYPMHKLLYDNLVK